MGTRFLLMVGVLVVAAAGCATQADIQTLSREQRRLSGGMADTRARVEAMQRDIAKVRGGLDELRHAHGAPVRSPRVEGLEARIMELEKLDRTEPPEEQTEGEGEKADSEEPVAEEPPQTVDPLEAEPPPDAPEEYRKGLASVRGGEYDRAIQSFRSFIRTDGDSPLAPNAHYWIGDSYFMLGDYYQAILNFNDVRQRYPTSDRAPAAVLKIGLAFLKMGNKTEARLAFQKVVQDYPRSSEASKAKEQLRALRT